MALISVAEALDHVLARAAPLPPETVPLDAALHRMLAAELNALRTQPPADVSAMDGYAVRTADVAKVPARLRVIGEVAAGRPFTAKVGGGEAARIFTGGVVPSGADTIVVQEITERAGDAVTVLKPVSKGRHIRRQGLDFRRGDSLFPAGHHRARPGAHRRHEPSDCTGASAPDSRALRHRRRIGAARRGTRTGTDCVFERFRARRAGASGGRRRDRSRARPG